MANATTSTNELKSRFSTACEKRWARTESLRNLHIHSKEFAKDADFVQILEATVRWFTPLLLVLDARAPLTRPH